MQNMSELPIGIFDSGVGGLTVAREIANHLPHESIYYFGDTLRCPYGPRTLEEVKEFALQISHWLIKQEIKLLVIACNSATAAGLKVIQRTLDVPVIGVIEPGARAAVQVTTSRRVGVIGTIATIESGAYTRAIRSIDAGITVFSAATPRFVEIVEQDLRLDHNPFEGLAASAASIYLRPAFQEIARDYLEPLNRCKIDTLVLGCTHYPLLTPLIQSMLDAEVRIISSAEETARDVAAALKRRGHEAAKTSAPQHRFATTTPEPEEFMNLGSMIFQHALTRDNVTIVPLEELEDARAKPLVRVGSSRNPSKQQDDVENEGTEDVAGNNSATDTMNTKKTEEERIA